MFCSKFLLCFVSILLFINHAFAEDLKATSPSSLDINDFIESAYTPTFDCPAAEQLEQLNSFLSQGNISQQQKFQLTSMKTHSLICAGDYGPAQKALKTLLAEENANRSARYYLSAIYQYGFIFDTQENPERCNYYMLARDAAKDKFIDIHVSASLGYITECQKNEVNDQLRDIYQLLETITKMDNKAALAHAYNRVGIFYSSIGKSALAASQYMKAYELGKEIYTDANNLTILTSAMTVLLVTNDLKRAKEVLDDFITINKKVATPNTNFLQYFLESGYYIRVKDFDSLQISLANWKKVAGNSSNPVYQGLYRWYSAALCQHNEDLACLREFVENEKNSPKSYQDYTKQSKDYLQFMVEVNIAINNKEDALIAFQDYVKKTIHIQNLMQDLNQSISVADLHLKISNLELLLEEQAKNRDRLMLTAVSIFLVIVAGIIWFARRKYVESKSYDNITGLLNNKALINKLTHLPAPSSKCTNALAIFDIVNFTHSNASVMAKPGDVVLLNMAKVFRKITRNSDILGRYDNNQFILCLANIEEDAAQAFFERVKEALTDTFSDYNNHQAINVESSMSIYYSSEKFGDINEIISNMLFSLRVKASNE